MTNDFNPLMCEDACVQTCAEEKVITIPPFGTKYRKALLAW